MAYEQMVSDILKAVGGKENVSKASHCATRLRLVLKDESLVDKKRIDNLDKVAGSVFSGMGLLVIGIGIVGLIFSIIGFMECK